MKFNSEHPIDEKIRAVFSEEILESVNPEDIEYFGINLSSDADSDFVFKIYYENRPSQDIYAKNNRNPILEHLLKLNMVRNLQVVNDNVHFNFSKFDIGLKNRTNENMLNVFSFFEQNIPLFKKYKDEIINLSKMKVFKEDDYEYASFHFIGFVYENTAEPVLFKSYWSNFTSFDEEIFSKDYYINYLKNTGIPQFIILSEIADNILNICGGRLYMEGTDYTNDGPVSHKIYIRTASLDDNIYDGLVQVLPADVGVLKERIEIIKNWNTLHSELKCDGFAIGLDNHNNLNLKLYYKVTGTEKIIPSSFFKPKERLSRYYPVKDNSAIHAIRKKMQEDLRKKKNK